MNDYKQEYEFKVHEPTYHGYAFLHFEVEHKPTGKRLGVMAWPPFKEWRIERAKRKLLKFVRMMERVNAAPLIRCKNAKD